MKKYFCTSKYLNADSGIKAFPFKYLSVLPLYYLTCSNENLYTLFTVAERLDRFVSLDIPLKISLKQVICR